MSEVKGKDRGKTGALVPGAELGPYRIIDGVGHGGMASVYKAYQASLSRLVALKVLPPQMASDSGFATRFHEEAVAVASLRHPSILAVHDYGEIDGVTFIVNEFIDGGTLEQQLGSPLPLRYVVDMLEPIAEALDYAHSRGMIHRDVKPSNILITRDGKPLLGDFGLARMMAADRDITQAGMILGTPAYMAPEQGDGDARPESDIYALGVIAYQALTGRVPFTAATPMAVILAHQHDPLPLPTTVNPKIAPGVERALLKCLARAPEDRFSTAQEFIKALRAQRRASAGTPAEAPRRSPLSGNVTTERRGESAGVVAGSGADRTNRNAVLSLVLALVGFATCPLVAGIGAIGLGRRAEREIDATGEQGREVAMVGRWVGWFDVFLGSVSALFLAFVLVLWMGLFGIQNSAFNAFIQRNNPPGGQVHAASSPSPQASPTPVTLPALTLSRSSGPPGTKLTASGTGFDPNDQIEFRFGPTLIGQTAARADGSFGPVTLQLPSDATFFTEIQALGRVQLKHATAVFRVT